jgi:ESCRT-II complex subunit VPS36
MLSAATPVEGTAPDNIRLSFRAGGEKSFYERLKNAMVQRKWLLEGAPSPPVPSQPVPSSMPSKFSSPDSSHSRTYVDQQRTVGIAGLKARSLATREKNSVAISTAFEDLEALMTSAKEIIALAESFSSHLPSSNTSASSNEATQLLAQSTSALGLITTKDSSESSLYHSLLARTLADLLTDDATGILKREGGIISLVDLWALFNRARGGVELVSPSDFLKACEMFEKLKLPLRLRRFKSGLLAVQGSDMEDSKIIARVKAWLETPADEVPDTVQLQFGRGVTPREAAERFGWSVGVAREELEMAEEKGAVCREEGVGGVRFWINWIVQVD